MEKRRILVVGLIGLLLMAGLGLIGCVKENCPGSGDCTVTIEQGTSGLYVDTNAPRSSCGKSATWSSDTNSYSGGCKVQNYMDGRNRKYGTHGCDCTGI